MNFKFIELIDKDKYNNLVYTFHYYMPDIAFQNCNWSILPCEIYGEKIRDFETEDPESKTIKFDLFIDKFPDDWDYPFLHLSIGSYNQFGSYSISSVKITDSDEKVVFEDCFTDKKFCVYDYDNETYDCDIADPKDVFCDPNSPDGDNCAALLYDDEHPEKSWQMTYGGMYNSAPDSVIKLQDGSAVIANTMKREYNNDEEERDQEEEQDQKSWAVLNLLAYIKETCWGNYDYNCQCAPDSCSQPPYPITLEPGKTYTLEIETHGELLSDSSSLWVNLFYRKREDNNDSFKTLWSRTVSSLCCGEADCMEERLVSDVSRIEASMQIMKEVRQTYGVPLFLSEFGVPLRIEQDSAFNYFHSIVDSLESNGLNGWGLYCYRQPESNRTCDECEEYITFGLFSGWDESVQEMLNPYCLADEECLSDSLGTSEYYYWPDFIKELVLRLRLTDSDFKVQKPLI